MAKTSGSNSKTDLENKETEQLQLEVAHTMWFLQTGQNITDVEKLHEAWKKDFPDAHLFAIKLVRALYARGILLNYYDESLSHFK